MNINSPNVELIFDTFREFGYKIYAVGGCVRDIVLGKEPKDIDFCTDATPDEMKEIYFKHFCRGNVIKLIPTGEKFGTLTFRFSEQNEQYEITTFRTDGRYEDGRHPKEVSYTKTLEEDLSRRDFTINAIAYNPEEGLVDPFNGLQDIENRVVRCVGDPKERFNEDALRILRLVRFAIRYNFDIEHTTYLRAIELVNNLNYVSRERVGKELQEIFNYRLVNLDIHSRSAELLRIILRQIFPLVDTDVKSMVVLAEHVPLLRWYDCCVQENEQEMMTFINRFAVGSDIANGVKNLRRAFDSYKHYGYHYQKRVLGIIRTSEERKAFLSRLIMEQEDIEPLVRAIVNNEPYSIEQLAVDGNWIMKELNLSPGPEVKEMLEKILDYICVNPYFNTENDIRKFIVRTN